jgi:hypothetical protein
MIDQLEARIVRAIFALHSVIAVGIVCWWEIRHLYIYLFR